MLILTNFLRHFPHFTPKGPLSSSLIHLPKTLIFKGKASYFWNLFKKTKKLEASKSTISTFPEPEITSDDESSLDFSKDRNLKFLIDEIITKNKEKAFLLPPKDPKYQGKKTIVLEMDETLLYTFYPDEQEAYLLAPSRDYDYYVDFPEHKTFLSIYLRNNFKEFLCYLQENFEPILYCNGVKEYVDKVMDIVDKDKVFIHRIYQDGCDQIIDKQENLLDFTKDLNRLNRDLSQVILIDARPFNFWINPDNCNFYEFFSREKLFFRHSDLGL